MARTATLVDKNLFELAVKNAEKNGPLKNLGLLFIAIVKQYMVLIVDRDDLNPISAAIVRDRLESWGIKTQTTAGRTNKTELWTARVAELVSAITLIRSLIPAEQADLLGLFDELQYTIEKPLVDPASKADEPANEADETEEVIDPNEETVETAAETGEPVAAAA